MLDFLYYMCLEPLSSAMRDVLIFSQAQTGSWGFSLILLSLAVNIVLLPLYHLAEGWQESERIIQENMRPKLKEIKEVFRGRERYMYMRALYRLHGYSPLFAIRAAFGLLIQIPFFFAAYSLLNNMPELSGVSWLCFSDLSRPDALLPLGFIAVNVMPFVMTGANLLSAAVYTSRLSFREKRKLYFIAAIFLVLLYPSSSALLIYWTCNNLFSLGKNIFYNKFVYKKQTVAGAAQKRRPDLVPALCSLLVFIAALVFRKQVLLNLWLLLPLMAASLAMAAAALWLRWSFIKGCRETWRGISAKNFGILPVIIAALLAVCLWKLTPYKVPSLEYKNLFYLLSFVEVGLLAGWASLHKPLNRLLAVPVAFARNALTDKTAASLYAASCFAGAALICWYTPIAIYVSDPEALTEPFSMFGGELAFNAVVLLVISGLFFHWAKPDIRPLLACVYAWAVLCALIYTFVAVGDYGHIEGFVLQKKELLRSKSRYLVDLGVLLGAAAAMALALGKKKWRLPGRLALLLQGVAFALVFVASFQAATTEHDAIAATGGQSSLPAYNDGLFGFSRDKENTLVLMLDGFTGSQLGVLLEREPELAAKLDGFTWYPDTVGPGSSTNVSIAALFGGENYTLDAVLARKPEIILYEMIKGFSQLPCFFASRDRDVTIANAGSFNTERIAKTCPRVSARINSIPGNISMEYLSHWQHKNPEKSVKVETRNAPVFISMAVFRAAPWSLRKRIYDDANWLKNNINLVDRTSELEYAMLDLLPDVSSANAASGTFKIFISNAVHRPWHMDENCRVIKTKQRLEEVGNDPIEMHLNTERCALNALARWFDWMKKTGVYDNTMILIVSDHSSGDGLTMQKEFKDLPPKGVRFWPDTLLLVKPRNSEGMLKEDARPMYGADLPALICTAEGPCPEIEYSDPLAERSTPRKRKHITADDSAVGTEKMVFEKPVIYEVTGSSDKREHWKIIEGDK